jgi:pimeloyl-ACP methyl ester carboxylesterase
VRRHAGILALAALALACILLALWRLAASRDGIAIERRWLDATPVTLFRPQAEAEGARSRPVVVIAHGFAGSQQLMQPFALAFARQGYTAVTFDFLGHGRNARLLGGSVTEVGGATRALVEHTGEVAGFARAFGDGRLVLLGHSMASDIVIRAAQTLPDVVATIAVSPFSQAVTATSPRNLLLIAGGWETYLAAEARKLVAQVSTSPEPADGVTYGDFSAGTARRLAIAPGVEHVSVLYSRVSVAEAVDWAGRAAGAASEPAGIARTDGLWIMLLLAGLVALVRPLSVLLPVVGGPARAPALERGRFWAALILPAIATPLILRVTPTHFLPILVADYLAAHFAVLGLLTGAAFWWAGGRRWPERPSKAGWGRIGLAALLASLISFVPLAAAIDAHVTSFQPVWARLPLILALFAGTLAYGLANEALTRSPGAPRFAFAASQAIFLVSLGLAIALDFKRLFFLAIIVPVIVPFLLVFGLFSHWFWRRTRHPFVAAIANALAFACAIGVTFPMLTG